MADFVSDFMKQFGPDVSRQLGDTLGAIAQRLYGKASLYPKIFEANRDILANPDLIKVGQKLKIPKL
jgi:nucleoid-associated protein YgaU